MYSLQFGFQENHSIDNAQVHLTKALKSTHDNKRLSCGIFIDFKRAFHTVNHTMLPS